MIPNLKQQSQGFGQVPVAGVAACGRSVFSLRLQLDSV